MAKYIIEIEDKPVNGLYKAKAFNTLVFDRNGLDRLKLYEEPPKKVAGENRRRLLHT